ncbi:MAG: hypothetical protein M0004_09850 [Actinomycetota bacterium]|nr:hypothetical protein [Actinomycetota bacterium]
MSTRTGRRWAASLLAAPLLSAVLASGAGLGATAAGATTTSEPGGSTTTTLAAPAQPTWPLPYTDDDDVPVFPSGISLGAATTWLGTALAVRIQELVNLGNSIDASRLLPQQTKSNLDGTILSDYHGLYGLLHTVANATDLPTLQGAADAMVIDYRVNSVLLPSVHAIVALEAQLAEVRKLQGIETALQTAIGSVQSGKLANQLGNLAGDFGNKLTSVVNADQLVVSQLLNLTPSDYPIDSAIGDAQATLGSSGATLKNADDDLRQILNALGGANLGIGAVRSVTSLRTHLLKH